MTFPVTSVAPPITRAELDLTNDALKPVVKAIRLTHRQWMERVFIGALKPAEYLVLSAIVSRTFGWSKALEIITLDQFANGHQHPALEMPLLTHDKMPVWCGTGQDRKTIVKALSGLYHQGMITRFRFSAGGRDAMAYMPTTIYALQTYLEKKRDVELNGELPPAISAAKRQAPDGTLITSAWERAFTFYAIGDPITEDEWV